MFVSILTQVLALAILVRALLSWVNPRQDNPIVRFLNDITEPILAPLRRVVPMVGMMDLSPLIAMLVLNYGGSILSASLRSAGL